MRAARKSDPQRWTKLMLIDKQIQGGETNSRELEKHWEKAKRNRHRKQITYQDMIQHTEAVGENKIYR